MAIISIEIDIQNPHNVVQKQKGKLAELFAGLFMDRKKLKNEVEASVCKEIIKLLQPKIDEGLAEKGIEATVTYAVTVKSEE